MERGHRPQELQRGSHVIRHKAVVHSGYDLARVRYLRGVKELLKYGDTQ